ncbi:MAG: hypothetical protein V1685_04770 [Parcubacteria group bacterium]
MGKKKGLWSTVLVATALTVIVGTWCAMAVRESARAEKAEVRLESVQQPVKSVQELAERYSSEDLTPSQKRLVKAGFYPDRVNPITIKK